MPSKRFERKWTDEQIRAVRFDYEGMTNAQVSTITGIPYHTVKAYRGGKRRTKSTGRKMAPKERWQHMKQEELRLFFIGKCKLLFDLYKRMQEKLDETGEYVEPQPTELAIKQSFRIGQLSHAPVAEREPAPPKLPEPAGRPEILSQDGRRRPRLTGTQGILFARR